MKPRLFIGSSSENLEIAYSLQSNLDYDGSVTVWTQGVFNLSSNALNDLLAALNNFDFAIFIFQPNDVVKMRNSEFLSVRDNIIFELGLFLGRLGKERVFYLVDRDSKNLHLPTDLVGMSPGTYDGNREDGNLQAALGPFCQEIRKKLKSFLSENLIGFENETNRAKNLAITKPPYWEFDLVIELLNSKLGSVKNGYFELEQGLLIQRPKRVTGQEMFEFYQDCLAIFQNLVDHLLKGFKRLQDSFGPPGVPGNSFEIKGAVEYIVSLSKELLAWECDVYSLQPPDAFSEVKTCMQGWSQFMYKHISNISPMILKALDPLKEGKSNELKIHVTLDAPSTLSRPLEIFEEHVRKYGALD
jgi:hypothetical protein